MSELHTLRGQVADYEDRIEEYENESAEREYEMMMLDAERQAQQDAIDRMNRINEQRAARQDRLNQQLAIQVQAEQRRRTQEIAALRKSNQQALTNLNSKFQNQIADAKARFQNDLNGLRKETKRLINDHRQAVQLEMNKLNTEISSVKFNVNAIQSQIKNTEDDKRTIVHSLVDSMDQLLSEHENDLQSPLKHPDTRPHDLDILSSSRIEIDQFKKDLALKPTGGQLDTLFTKAFIKFEDITKDLEIAENEANKLNAKYKAVLVRFNSLINHAKENKNITLSILDPQASASKEAEKWKEVRMDVQIDVDFWTRGEYNVLIGGFQKVLDTWNQDFYLDQKITNEALTLLQTKLDSFEEKALKLRKTARARAVNSNLRETQAYRLFQSIVDGPGATSRKVTFGEGNDGIPDPRNRVFLEFISLKQKRVITIGSDESQDNGITINALAAPNDSSIPSSYNDITTEDAKVMLNSAIEDLNLENTDGSKSQVKTSTTDLCKVASDTKTLGQELDKQN